MVALTLYFIYPSRASYLLNVITIPNELLVLINFSILYYTHTYTLNSTTCQDIITTSYTTCPVANALKIFDSVRSSMRSRYIRVTVTTSTTSAHASIPIPMYSATSHIISYMFNVIMIPHIRADSTGHCDMFLSVLQIPVPTLKYSALADLADFRGLIGYCSAVVQISGGTFKWTAGT